MFGWVCWLKKKNKGNILSLASLFTCPLEDSAVQFNLSKADLNVFHLPSTVCGRQHRLQEPEERETRLLNKEKVLQATPGVPSLTIPPPPSSFHLSDPELPVSPCATWMNIVKNNLKKYHMKTVLEDDQLFAG